MGAGSELRARWDASLAERSKEIGGELEWTLIEERHLQAACRLADLAEDMDRLFRAAMESGKDPGVVCKLSAEWRALTKAMLDHLARVSLDDEPAKSPQHQRAANSRWDRRRAEHEAARQRRGY